MNKYLTDDRQSWEVLASEMGLSLDCRMIGIDGPSFWTCGADVVMACWFWDPKPWKVRSYQYPMAGVLVGEYERVHEALQQVKILVERRASE